MDDYCRLCMGEENLLPIDDEIHNCIKNAFCIEVQKNDSLSREICEQCYEFVIKLIQFKNKVLKVQKLLQKIVKRKDHMDTADCIDKTLDETPMVIDAIEDIPDSNGVFETSNELISKTVKSLNNLDQVEENDLLSNSNHNNFCQICVRKFNDVEKFSKHLKTATHVFKINVIKRTGEANIFSSHVVAYSCSKCERKFTSKKILADHMRSDHNTKCNKNLLKPDTIIQKDKKDDDVFKQNHEDDVVKVEPGVEKQYPCSGCDKFFAFQESLRRHIQRHHKNIFLCMHCNFASINKRRYIDHIKLHYDWYTNQHRICSKCFKICGSQSELFNHRNEAHFMMVCDICEQTFKNGTSLKKHMRDVHRTQSEVIPEKKSLKCRRCHRGFTSVLALEKHQCAAMKYPCVKKCGKRFETYSIMQRHAEKCNHGTTIYSCEKCNKSLRSMFSLQRHMTKCLSKISSSSTSESKAKISRKEPAKKVETLMKYFNDEIEESSSPLIEPSHVETDAVLEERRVDENIKTTPSQISTTLTEHKKQAEVKTKKNKKSKSESEKLKKIQNSSQKTSEVENAPEKDEKLACQVCGQVVNGRKFLVQHELILHSTLADQIGKTTTQCIQSSEHGDVPRPLKRPKSDIEMQVTTTLPLMKFEEKYEQEPQQNDPIVNRYAEIPRPPVIEPVSHSHKLSSAKKNEKRSERYHESINYSNKPLFWKNYENTTDHSSENRRQNEKKDTDRSSEENFPSKLSYTSRQFDQRPKYQSFTPSPTNHRTDRYTSRNRLSTWSAPKSRWDCSYNPKTSSPSQSMCLICKNPDQHLYCNPCCRCFIQNHVQYLNHMKMKHHVWYVFTFIDFFHLYVL